MACSPFQHHSIVFVLVAGPIIVGLAVSPIQERSTRQHGEAMVAGV
jgi:hypothetical protein